MRFKKLTMLDTYQFQQWAEKKYGLSNQEWHNEIWHNKNGVIGLCEHFDETTYVTFKRFAEPKSPLEIHINAFLDEYPELNNEITLEFTN